MLSEVTAVRQDEGEPPRRWFTDEEHDLIVWLTAERLPQSFQFCYGKGAVERALTWKPETGFIHQRVDDGERMGWQKSTPILDEREPWDPDGVTQAFLSVSADLPMDVSGFVMERLVAATGNGHRRKAPAGRRRR